MQKAEKPQVEITAFLRDGVPTVRIERPSVPYIVCTEEKYPADVCEAAAFGESLFVHIDYYLYGKVIDALYRAQNAIVRCGECRHWVGDRSAKELASCDCDALLRHKDFFCANGERRTEE